jgi:hypothetical protein
MEHCPCCGEERTVIYNSERKEFECYMCGWYITEAQLKVELEQAWLEEDTGEIYYLLDDYEDAWADDEDIYSELNEFEYLLYDSEAPEKQNVQQEEEEGEDLFPF